MRTLITGATGFIGKALVAQLLRDGHAIGACVRDKVTARASLGPNVELISLAELDAVVPRADAVVNLAGEPILGRWTVAKKARVMSSRVDLSRRIADSIVRASPRPAVLLAASAVGYYGNRGDDVLTEASGPGQGFLTDVCVAWEAATASVELAGVRRAIPRIGVVLGSGGGALAKMVIPFRVGVGGRLGSGEQWVPWVHLDDLIALFLTALRDDRYSGPLNATAPEPSQNLELTAALGEVLGRPTRIPAPEVAIRLALGEAAAMVLDSTRAKPERALELGFQYRFSDLRGALRDALSTG